MNSELAKSRALSCQCGDFTPITFAFTQTLLKWHHSIYSVFNAVQIWSSTAIKPKITLYKVMINEPLPYLVLKLFSVQLIPGPAGCTPDLVMGFLPSHGSDSQQNTSYMLGHPPAAV